MRFFFCSLLSHRFMYWTKITGNVGTGLGIAGLVLVGLKWYTTRKENNTKEKNLAAVQPTVPSIAQKVSEDEGMNNI